MKISRADLDNFQRVMAHHEFDSDEIEICKQAYRNDPESGKTTYASIAGALPTPVDTRQWVKLSPPPVSLEKKRD